MPAQRLAQTRPGAQGALLFEACIPITGDWAFGPWPRGVPVQIHGMDADPVFAGDGDIDRGQSDRLPSCPTQSSSSTPATSTSSPTLRSPPTTGDAPRS